MFAKKTSPYELRMSGWRSDVWSSDRTFTIVLTKGAANKNSHTSDRQAGQVDVRGEFSDVKPGETKTFSFVAKYPGAFYYHCGADPMYQHIARGMFGVIQIGRESCRERVCQYV